MVTTRRARHNWPRPALSVGYRITEVDVVRVMALIELTARHGSLSGDGLDADAALSDRYGDPGAPDGLRCL